MQNVFKKFTLVLTAIAALAACDDDDDVKPDLRADIDYAVLDSQADYSGQFVDKDGLSTVDFTEGNIRYEMFQALNYHSTSSVSANIAIDASKLENLYTNTGNPFYDITTPAISVTGAILNTSGLQLRDVTASSLSSADAEVVRTALEDEFEAIATASLSVNETAAIGQAGKLGAYLVDDKGIEIAQIIQKSLIGSLQLDYISNVLLDGGLNADNHSLVSDNNYSALEHNWDIAYGLLTLNEVYLKGSTDATRGTVEFGLGSYIWEYNKANYANIYPAFLKGRAAIVNNDRAELQKQATFIRTEMENSIARAALGYLDKWKTGDTDAARAHAIGEGLGFIYSLRFAKLHGGDAAFSDNLINGLVGSENGFWDLDATKINTAADAIKVKFGF